MSIKNKAHQIHRLQENLSALRKIAGWSAENLGNKIGVTKQTISNLENKKTPMNLTQYIAIRTIFDYEIQNNPENEVLQKVIYMLIDKGDEISEDEYKKLEEVVSAVSLTVAGGVTGATLSAILTGSLASLGIMGLGAIPIVGIALGSSSLWLNKILKDKKDQLR